MSVLLLIGIVMALILDHVLGEPRQWHPLVGFGRYSAWLEGRLNTPSQQARPETAFCLGMVAVIVTVLPPVLLVALLCSALSDTLPLLNWLLDIIIAYWAIGWSSLQQHVRQVRHYLFENDIPAARSALSLIVSRDTSTLDQTQICIASVETTLENGNDALFAVLFWYLIGGAPLVICYRLVNTLDAMWGYRTPQYTWFGKPAARLDDLLNFVPARLTALSYALAGRLKQGLDSWRASAPQMASPNAGPVMAAGAGSLGLRLGGDAIYHQQAVHKACYGGTKLPNTNDIDAAIHLVWRALALWLSVILLITYLARVVV